MAHVAFLDERYNKPKLIIRSTVTGAAVWRTYLTYTHVNN